MAGTSQPPRLTGTDILIDASGGPTAAIIRVEAEIAANRLVTSVITAMELTQGSRDLTAKNEVRQLSQRLTTLPVSAVVSQSAHPLVDILVLGHNLKMPSALIAATALEHGLMRYSRNVPDSTMIPSLPVRRPH